MAKSNVPPPSARIGTILILLALTGIGLLENLYYLLACLLVIIVFAGCVSRSSFVTVYKSKGILVFFALTGISLLWTAEGRILAPVLLTKMTSMWLWILVWINWVGFEWILTSLSRIGIPSILINIITFTARFLPILSERLKMMLAAQESRGAKRGVYLLQLQNLARGIACMLISSFEQSENVERAMRSRGFTDTFPEFHKSTTPESYGSTLILFLVACFVWIGVIYHGLCCTRL